MIKKLQRHGNSHALVLDKAIMEAMNITATTPLQINVSGNALFILRATMPSLMETNEPQL